MKITSLSGSILDGPQQPALSVTLANIGNESIEFPAGYGPWSGPGNSRFGLVALRLPVNIPIVNNSRPLINPEPGNLELAPGGSIKQELLLQDFFPAAEKAISLGQEDIIIFWTYQLVVRGQPRSEHFGGWVLYQKRSGIQ
jgi:hypothetical protein